MADSYMGWRKFCFEIPAERKTAHMIAPSASRTSSKVATATPIAIAFLIASYILAAFVFGLWPMSPPVVAACPAATAHQVFVDPTASNEHVDNWKEEAQKFAETLSSCDEASFWLITDNSSSTAQYGASITFPLIDENAPIAEIQEVRKKILSLRSEVKERIVRMTQEHGAKRSDVIGVFFRLKPAENRRNMLDVFSDGKESSGRINLEDGHTCVSPENVSGLVDLALYDRPVQSPIAAFQGIQWILPDASGKRGCNSRDELELFWSKVVSRLAQPTASPALRFDTNLF
jgi:hypothetical protein